MPPVAIMIVLAPAIYKQGINLASILILCFCGFVIFYSLFLYLKRLQSFKELHVDDKKILAIYDHRKPIEIAWRNVDEVLVDLSYRKKMIKIRSKDGSDEITIGSEVKNYDLLMEMIEKYTKTTTNVNKEI